MDIAVLGLGEAGARYAADLAAAGQVVRGYDPADTPTPHGVVRSDSVASAVAGAGLVLGFTGPRYCEQAAEEAAPELGESAVFADCNTASPETKLRVGDVLGDHAADVAVLAPVPRAGARTPLLVSGPGAHVVAAYFRDAVDAPVDSFDGPMGAAAGRKLLRSVFMKGLAAVVIEADEAAAAAGERVWLRGQMAAELGPDGADLIDRLIHGTHQHAERRLHEMEDATNHLSHLGAHSEMSIASTLWLARLSTGSASA